MMETEHMIMSVSNMNYASLTTTSSTVTMAAPTLVSSSVTTTMPAPKLHPPPARSRRMPTVDPTTLIPARRSSTRSIKRKKFDDELVESSLVKTERGRVKGGAATPTTTTAATSPISPQVVSTLPLTASLSVRGAAMTAMTPPSGSASLGSVGLGVYVSTPSVAMATVHSQTVVHKIINEDAEDPGRPTDQHPVARAPPEKRSKPSTGKSAGGSAKGFTGKGGSSSASRAISGKGSSSKGTGSKVGAAKSAHGKSKSKSSKRSRKQKTTAPAVKDLGRWKPHDDLALITAVQQTNDLSSVYTSVKFSCRFTLKEIEERWYALLYDQPISKIAMEAARQLHSDTVASIQGKALYSNAEEKLLGTFTSTSQPSLDNFQSHLQLHPDVFHPSRTAKTLQCHWLLMKQCHLLPDQSVQPMPRGDHVLNLSDIEDFMNDEDIAGTDEAVEHELAQVDRRNKREIRHLEQELPKWQVLVDSVTGISMPDFDSQTLGVLRGRLVRYLMRSREISLGRATKDSHVDVDLSLEGPAWKVSRRQGIIKLRNSGEFFLANEGKRPIMVDGKPVMAGNKQRLNNNSVVEISCLRFTFLINQEVINGLKADSSKSMPSATISGTT